MKRLILISILWCLAIAIGRAQDSNTPSTDGTPVPLAIPATTESSPSNSRAIVLIVDADVQQSEVVKQVVEALEKAGVATTRAAETEPFANSSINVTLGIRKDVSHEHVTQLVKALADAGVHSVSFREGLDQGEEQNRIDVRVEPGYSESELAKIYNAVDTVQKECGLTLLVATKGLPRKAEKSRPLDANLPKADSFAEVRPVNGQPSPYRPLKSEPPRRVAEPKRIVIQPGVDAQESEVVWQFLADLEKAGIAKVIETEMTPTSESPIVTQVFMREDESFEKIKLFLVDLRASGVEKLVLEFGGLHPEGYADKQHNGLVFRATKEYSQDSLQRLEKVIQAAAERCGLSLYLAGTHVVPSGPELLGPPDEAASPGYASSFRSTVPQLRIDYEAANKQAHDLAESLRQTPDAAKKAELRKAVLRAFTLRQSLLRAELQEMQARLEKTQQSLDMRDRMADQIVDRRVEDLLNPQFKWDGEDDIIATPPIISRLNATNKPKTAESTSAELEGDWHSVHASDQTGAESPHFNIIIHGNTWTRLVDGKPEAIDFLCDSAKKTIEFKSTPPLVYTYEVHGDSFILHNETQTQAFNRGHRLPPDATELEGDWRQMSSATDKDGKPLTGGYASISFRKNQYTHATERGQHRCRVDVISNKKEIRYFHEGEYNFFVQDYYLLEGDQLTIYDENRKTVYRRIKVRH